MKLNDIYNISFNENSLVIVRCYKLHDNHRNYRHVANKLLDE